MLMACITSAYMMKTCNSLKCGLDHKKPCNRSAQDTKEKLNIVIKRCSSTEVLPSGTAIIHFGLAITPTGNSFCQPQSVPNLRFSKFYVQQNFTVVHA